jgi:ABC-2 type transport system ATP-binding protein
MIFAEGIFKTYKGGVTALNGVDLSISKGDSFSLLGPNGAGKSSLVSILTALSRPTSGLIRIDGEYPLMKARGIMRKIGVAPQSVCLDRDETPYHLLQLQGRLFGMGKSSHARADELITLFRLENEADKKISTMSGGNQRRLHIALSLVHRPGILFMDEPTVGMDPESRAIFWDTISSLNRTDKTTVFLTTQYLDEAEKHTRSMALLINGRIEWDGSVSDFKKTISTDSGTGAKTETSLEENYLHFIARYRAQEKSA